MFPTPYEKQTRLRTENVRTSEPCQDLPDSPSSSKPRIPIDSRTSAALASAWFCRQPGTHGRTELRSCTPRGYGSLKLLVLFPSSCSPAIRESSRLLGFRECPSTLIRGLQSRPECCLPVFYGACIRTPYARRRDNLAFHAPRTRLGISFSGGALIDGTRFSPSTCAILVSLRAHRDVNLYHGSVDSGTTPAYFSLYCAFATPNIAHCDVGLRHGGYYCSITILRLSSPRFRTRGFSPEHLAIAGSSPERFVQSPLSSVLILIFTVYFRIFFLFLALFHLVRCRPGHLIHH